MLFLFQVLRGRTVRARDGEPGVVHDVLFDERNWSILHFVVKTGSWLTRRKVLIEKERIVGIDRESGQLVVELDVRGVRRAPGIQSRPPRSRQRRIAYLDAYRRWLPWTKNRGVSPLGTMRNGEQAFDGSDREVRHTRSAREVVGYRLQASDRPAGIVTDLVVDDEEWRIPYLSTSAGIVLTGGERLLESNEVRDIELARRLVRVGLDADEVERAPVLEVSDGVVRTP